MRALTISVLLVGIPALAEGSHVVEVDTTSELRAAVAAAAPGDSIRIASGSYAVNLIITRDGTSAEPITLRAADGAIVILSAADPTMDTIAFESASHWRLRNLHIRGSRHAMVAISGGTNLILDDLEIYDGTKKGIIANGDDITISNCVIRNISQPVSGSDTQGIAMWRASRVRIKDSSIATPGDGILIGGAGALSEVSTDIRIYRNHFHSLSAWYGAYRIENAIDIKNADGVIISDNEIHRYRDQPGNDGGHAINVHTHDQGAPSLRVDDVTIQRNEIYDVGRAVSAKGIYGPASDLVFRNNIVYAVREENLDASHFPGGVFVGDWDGAIIDQNTFVDVDHAAAHTYGAVSGFRFRNNIVRRSGGVVREASGGTVDYSCTWSSPATGGDHDVVANQEFMNDGERDYRLRSSSPCIDRGLDLGLPYLAAAPDIGRWEYEGSSSARLAPLETDVEPPSDGRPVDWAASGSAADPDDLGPPIPGETPAGDPTALVEEAPPTAGSDEPEATEATSTPELQGGCAAAPGRATLPWLVLGFLALVLARRRFC